MEICKIGKKRLLRVNVRLMVELRGIEPLTS
jgi:hypothetical protein